MYQVLFFCSCTPYLFKMLIFFDVCSTQVPISMVNRSCVPKPVIRILCASLVYKKRVIQIHSINAARERSVQRGLVVVLVIYSRPRNTQCSAIKKHRHNKTPNARHFVFRIFQYQRQDRHYDVLRVISNQTPQHRIHKNSLLSHDDTANIQLQDAFILKGYRGLRAESGFD